MIVDLHTHAWANFDQLGPQLAALRRRQAANGNGQLDGSPAAHERAMSCVDASVILGFRSQRMGARIPSEFVAEFAARDPRRRVGVAGVDPMSEDVFDEIDKAVGLGLVGVAVSPACQGFHPAHSQAMLVYERCAELGLPLFVTIEHPLTAAAEMEFARPAAWDEVARALPRLPIVIGEIGHPWVDEALMLIGKHERVFADISGLGSRRWQLYNALQSALAMGVLDKLLFGSGFPDDTPAGAIESVYTVNAYCHGTQLPSIARPLLRSIIEKDSLGFLGIESEIAPVRRDRDDAPLVEVMGRSREQASAGDHG